MRRIALTLLLAPLVVCGIVACKHGDAADASSDGGGGDAKASVETIRVGSVQLPEQFETIGSLRADASVVVRPEVVGKIVKIHFTEGQHVAEGAPLFSLDPALAQDALNEADANLDKSRRAFDRASEMERLRLIAHADLDTSKATLGVDQARAASARTMLEKTRIVAPFAGTIGLREASVGDYVNVGQGLANLVRLDPMEVDFSVPEVELAHVAAGQAVKLDVSAFPGRSFEGVVTAIDPVINPNSHSAQLRARVPNPGLVLRPGLFARVHVVYGTDRSALVIPEQAIWPDGDQKKVFRVENGKAKLVAVTIGVRQPGTVQILEGLKAGDEIVTAGQFKLHDGMGVAPAPSTDAAPVDAAVGSMSVKTVPVPAKTAAVSANGG
jgi:membrane fusion protein (multidrug efflux system)